MIELNLDIYFEILKKICFRSESMGMQYDVPSVLKMRLVSRWFKYRIDYDFDFIHHFDMLIQVKERCAHIVYNTYEVNENGDCVFTMSPDTIMHHNGKRIIAKKRCLRRTCYGCGKKIEWRDVYMPILPAGIINTGNIKILIDCIGQDVIIQSDIVQTKSRLRWATVFDVWVDGNGTVEHIPFNGPNQYNYIGIASYKSSIAMVPCEDLLIYSIYQGNDGDMGMNKFEIFWAMICQLFRTGDLAWRRWKVVGFGTEVFIVSWKMIQNRVGDMIRQLKIKNQYDIRICTVFTTQAMRKQMLGPWHDLAE